MPEGEALPERLPFLRYEAHAFTRPGDAPGCRVRAAASFLPFDDTGGGAIEGEASLQVTIHVRHDVTREQYLLALQGLYWEAESLFRTWEDARMRQALGERPQNPTVRILNDEEIELVRRQGR